MSFLLGQRTNRNNNPGVGRSRRFARNNGNNNAPARNTVGGNSRVLSSLESTASNRGNRKAPRQQASGNQMMLQRQKRRTLATTSKTQKQRTRQIQQKQQRHESQQRLEESVQQQEQQNLGDYTMDRVMQDLRILEQQQREAKRKLVSAQTNKEKLLDQMRQLNTQLENKNYVNGALRAKLQHSHDFLSIATRDFGNRKLATDRLEKGIADFEGKLKRGLRSAQMIQVCGAKIDSFLMVIEHRVDILRRLRMERTDKSTKIRQEYKQTEKKDRELRLAIQDTHKSIRKCGEEKATLRSQMKDLDNDKMIAHNADQMTLLQIQSAREKIRLEADRFASSRRKMNSEIEEASKVAKTIVSEIRNGSTSIESLKQEVRDYHEKIIECSEKEGYSYAKDATPSFDQEMFREDIRRIEEETKEEEDELVSLKKAIEEAELACKTTIERTLQNDNETSVLVSTAKSITEDEEKRNQFALDFQVSLKQAQGEISRLEKSFHEMEASRCLEAQANSKAIANVEDEIKQQAKVAEDLKVKLKQEDTSLKTKIRLFDDTEKLPLLRKLEKTKKNVLSEEKKYNDLVEISGETSIESNLKTEFELKFNDETKKWEAKSESLFLAYNENLRNFPRLQEIDCTFIVGQDRDKQIAAVLKNLERECTMRKIAVKKARDRGARAKKKRAAEVETKREKLKEKEESKSRLNRRHYRKESNSRVEYATLSLENANGIEFSNDLGDAFIPSKANAISSKRNGVAGRRQRRRKKGSDFFNPRKEGDDEMDDITPTKPKRLISSFLSQSSGQRVRWADSDIGDNEGLTEFSEGIDGNTDPQTQESNLSPSLNHTTPTIPLSKTEGFRSSNYDVKSTATKKPSTGASGGTRSQPNRNRSRINRRRESGALPSDAIFSKTTGLASTSKKKSSECKSFAKSMPKALERDAIESSTTTRKAESSRLSLSLSNDSNDKSRGKKSRRKHTDTKSLKKIHQNVDEEGTVNSQPKQVKNATKHFNIPRDTRKVHALQARSLREGKGNSFDIEPSQKTGYKKVPKNSHEETKTKLSNRSKRNRGKADGARNKKRSFFTDVDEDAFSLQVESSVSSNREKRAKTGDHGQFQSSHTMGFTKQDLLEKSRGNCQVESSVGKSGSLSRRIGRQEVQDKVREGSNKGSFKRPPEHDSRKKTTKTSRSSSLTSADNHGKKVGEKTATKIRKKSLEGGVGKRVKSGRENTRNEVHGDESLGGKSTACRGSSNPKTSSSSTGNLAQKKRKMNLDNVSVSSSKVSVTARRRKKRNTGLSQKSITTDVVDKSCDYNFE